MTLLLKPTSELDATSRKIIERIQSNSPTFQHLFDLLLNLLPFFDKTVSLLGSIGYCDYEVAYVTYQTCIQVVGLMKPKTNSLNQDIFKGVQLQTRKRASTFKAILSYFAEPETQEEDPLLNRFKSLSGGGSKTKSSQDEVFHEWITSSELQRELSSKKVLLIDFRPRKDYLNNHIKYKDLVHIEPTQLETLLDSASDQDLETLVKKSAPYDQYHIFLERHKYDLIVVYNYNYGSESTDRLLGIIDVVSKPNPFTKLITILMNNKYISSRLKVKPLFLSGGVLNWYKTFGIEYLERTLVQNGVAHTSDNQYLKSFNDYVSTSKETPKTQVKTQNGDYIRPSQRKVNQFDPVPVKSGPTVFASAKVDLPPTPGSPAVSTPSPPRAPAPPTKTTSLTHVPEKEAKSPSPVTKEVTVSSKKSQFLELYTTGLVNLGNSCYMNCVVQCLAAAPQLTSFFFPTITESFSDHSYRQHINSNNKLGTKGELTTSFVELILNMLNNNGKAFSPTKFKRTMGSLSPSQQFLTYDQQDCIEFLNFLLDALHEDLNNVTITDPSERKLITDLSPEQEKSRETLPVRLASTIEWERYLKLNFSVIVDYFQGQHLSQLKCLECGFTSTTYNAFSILSLPIPQKLNNLGKVLLKDCLEEFVTTELLDDNNKWYCPQCKRFTRLTKKIAITRLPQVLIVNFNRFKMTNTGGFNKLETFVTYPVNEELDMTPYWPDVGSRINENSTMSIEMEQDLLQSFPIRNQTPPFKYKLFGVANHFGNLTTGHYTSYVYKHSDSKKTRNWCYFDDSKITYNVSPSQVVNKNAYCLFFQRV
ncbi:Ubiquitin carboxyl-terminal hydrolase 4 [Candida viswanathii]|uniref:Ubiquitin carboxyl-terminal hydrolase n=1 Tax=Candida viswanathii TaxID=5486 RepID=A0A367YDX3_9ASCO|nr:Ubiquitin carboxyl-terminal hydrolase 4 [Candida viswanathii]